MEPKNGKDENGKFATGNKPPANRKTRGVSGRRKTLDSLDMLMAKAGNQEKYLNACQVAFDCDPLKFVHKYVVPLMPLFAKNPKLEEELAQMTDEERLQGITTILGAVRKRVARQVAEDDSFVESEGIEFSTN